MSSSLAKKKRQKTPVSSEIFYKQPYCEKELFLPPQLNNRREIFTYFFNFISEDFILTRELVMKPVDNNSDIESKMWVYRHPEEEFKKPPGMSFLKRGSIHGSKRKEWLQSDVASTKSTGSTFSQKSGPKVKDHKQISDPSFLKPCFDPETVMVNRIVFKNGNVYEGSVKDYLMDGQGTFTWTDKTVYRGQFKDGYISGKGEMILPDLSKYKGDFCQGLFHGTGELNILGTSLYYYGNWKNGKKHGKGWILYQPGDWYEGEWSNDLRNGIGYRRYKNGARYKGEWVNNKKQGRGKMLVNNDYYNGEWYDNKPHGYGEYTWNLIQNEEFCFPIYNYYKGSWTNGERDGIGIMNFGTECGSRYAGTWSKNNKHGPGVMICGNGLVLESNPLFEFNKPVHKSSQKNLSDLDEENIENDLTKKNLSDLDEKNIKNDFTNCTIEKGSYYEILKMVNSKRAYSKIDQHILVNITKNSSNIPPSMFVKLADSISGSKKIWCPLNIHIHSAAENIHFTYFIDTAFEYAFKHRRTDDLVAVVDEMEESSEIGARFKRSFISNKTSYTGMASARTSISAFHANVNKDLVDSLTERIQRAHLHEVETFRNLVLVNLPMLNLIYKKYATIARQPLSGGKKVAYKPVMVRLFLWQFFRDTLLQNGVEIAKVDSFMWKNPYCCLDTEHYPFEPIYFYQFVQYLMSCAWLMFKKKLENDCNLKLMYPSKILKDLLYNVFSENERPLNGNVLGEHLNIAPITRVYNLYASISEPMSVKTFFDATFRDEKEKLPCFGAISSGVVPKVVDAQNIVPLGHEIFYIQFSEPIAKKWYEEELTQNFDQFARSLLTFRSLGKTKLTECLTTVCPDVIINEDKLDMTYMLTFLEFYEIIIMCAFLKAEELIREECVRKSLVPMTSSTESTSKKDKFMQKKKFKKSRFGLKIIPSTR